MGEGGGVGESGDFFEALSGEGVGIAFGKDVIAAEAFVGAEEFLGVGGKIL